MTPTIDKDTESVLLTCWAAFNAAADALTLAPDYYAADKSAYQAARLALRAARIAHLGYDDRPFSMRETPTAPPARTARPRYSYTNRLHR